jgi:hypothetical protein
MSKLVYRTKPPRKGYVNHQSFMTHESKNIYDKLPDQDLQQQAHDIVANAMHELIKELKELGYDETRVGFYIHYNN